MLVLKCEYFNFINRDRINRQIYRLNGIYDMQVYHSRTLSPPDNACKNT